MSSELTLEQAMVEAKEWRKFKDAASSPAVEHNWNVIATLLEAIETMSPVVAAAEAWANSESFTSAGRVSEEKLLHVVATYREKREERKGMSYELTPRELLLQVREMADIGSAQEFDDDVARLRAIVAHIEGNLLDDDVEGKGE